MDESRLSRSESMDLEHTPQARKAADAEYTNTAIAAGISEQILLRRIDFRVLPPITIIYIMAFLDRVNIGNALLFHLPTDLSLHGNQVSIALSAFFVTYCVFEIPANLQLKRIKPPVFRELSIRPALAETIPDPRTSVSISMFLCGTLAIVQGFVQNFGGLVTVRLLLGIVEAGIFPGCFYLLSMWYQPREAQKRFSFFFNAASFAGAFGGLLASAIGKMDGIRGYHAWRWVFILEGLLTCVLAIASYFLIAEFPEDAKWLGNDERSFIVGRLAADQGESEIGNRITWRGIVASFKDWKMLLGALMYFGPTVSAYGLAYFIPTIVATYGYSPIQAQLHSVVPWAAALIFGMTVAYLSDRFQSRFTFVVVGLCLAITGNLILFTIHDKREVEFAGLALYTMGVISVLPVVVCWFTMNLKGHTNRAVGTAWQVGFGNLSGIVSTFAFPSADAPRYHLGYSLGLGCLCLAGVASLVYLIGCSLENKHRAGNRRLLL